MPAPGSYPVWLNKPGAPDALCMDAGSYTVLVGQGYTFGVTVPVVSVMVAGQLATIIETPVNIAQPDANPANQDEIS